jgi:hypothetical protein
LHPETWINQLPSLLLRATTPEFGRQPTREPSNEAYGRADCLVGEKYQNPQKRENDEHDSVRKQRYQNAFSY